MVTEHLVLRPVAAGGISAPVWTLSAPVAKRPPPPTVPRAAGAEAQQGPRRAIEAASGRVARRCARRAQAPRVAGATAQCGPAWLIWRVPSGFKGPGPQM